MTGFGGADGRQTTTEADPYGMTNKRTGNGKSKPQVLRLTALRSSTSRPCGLRLSDFAVFEDFVEHVGQGGGAVAGGWLRVLEGAGEVGDLVVALACGAKLVGDVEGGEDGDAEAAGGGALGGHGAHLGVDDGGEALDVGGVGAAEIVDLVVDVYGGGLTLGWRLRGRLWGFESLVHRVSFALRLEKFVHLLKHLFDTEADGFTLFVEGVE